jgi:hypothetical protein
MPRVRRNATLLSALLLAALATADCAYLFPSCATIPGCPKGQSLCSNLACSDLLSDPANCGVCNNACGPGLVCVPVDAPDAGAACGCPIPGQLLIHGQCIDPRVDPKYCGAADAVCRPDQACLDGGCGCIVTPYLAQILDGGSSECSTDAGPACADLLNDPLNCGGCGQVCTGACVLATCDGGMADAGELGDGGDGGGQANADGGDGG